MYAESKVKLLMLTAELQRRLRASGSNTDVFSVHPGVAQTDIFPKSDKEKLMANVFAAGAVAVGQSSAGGAQSILKVATDPLLKGVIHNLLPSHVNKVHRVNAARQTHYISSTIINAESGH